MRYFSFFSYQVSKSQYVFYIYSVSQFRPATLPVLTRHMRLGTIMLQTTGLQDLILQHATGFFLTSLIFKMNVIK